MRRLLPLVLMTLLAACAPSQAEAVIPPTVTRTTAPPTSTATALIAPSPTPLPTVTPLPTATPVPTVAYSMGRYEAPYHALGIQEIWLAEELPFALHDHAREDLRLPAEDLRPAGRFLEPRGLNDTLLHLGSDYIIFEQLEELASPSEQAYLVATAYFRLNTILSIALDYGGNTQIYLLRVEGEDYLFGYTHLRQGSNEHAIEQAQASGGMVDSLGWIDIVSTYESEYSDLHIGVMRVDTLLEITNQPDVIAALEVLFTGEIPRQGGQYTALFVEVETLMVALQPIVDAVYNPEGP